MATDGLPANTGVTIKTRDANPLPQSIESNTQERDTKITKVTKKRLDVQKIKKLKAKGLTNVECADVLHVSPQAIDYHVKRFELIPDLEDYKSRKADILESKQAEVLLHGLDTEKIKGATAQQAAVIFGILDDKLRLERGQATSIVDVQLRGLIAHLDLSQPQDVVIDV